ncbi:MAG: IS4 family transposase [Armatimonadota bacterium]
MSLRADLPVTADFVPEDLSTFRDRLSPSWIEEALEATGVATLRRRRLPAELVIWLMIGIALIRNRRIAEVAAKLDLALPVRSGKVVAAASIPPARERVGEEPVRWLFERTGKVWAAEGANEQRWRGLAIYGIDGTTLRVADSPDNRATFGGQTSTLGRGQSAYPMIRVLGLMALRTHVLAGAAIGGYKTSSELSLAPDLCAQVPDDSLTILDRNFLQPKTLVGLNREGVNRHWLTRAKKNTAFRVTQSLGPGDDLVAMPVSAQARTKDPTLGKTWTARAIRYQRKGFQPQLLLTSLLDPKQYPAAEMADMYHERWEIELGYGEIKTDLLCRRESLRSKKSEGVRQEVWGVLLAYNLVRLEMARIARNVSVPPTRMSFVLCLARICDEWMWTADTVAPGAVPKHLDEMRDKILRLVLPPRRPERSYPRAVKIKMSNYLRKRPAETTKDPLK